MTMPRDEAIDKMKRHCYGYGRRDAPYWFIGPEQGQRRVENGDLGPRLSAWVKLGSRELCDCAEFHREIDEHVWHRDGKLQSTWKRLIRLLMAFLEQPVDNDTLREYQRKRWGMADGETCVIELSGLAANNLTIPRDRQSFRAERIATIRERISLNRPRLVVMYGAGQRDSWQIIAGVFPACGFERYDLRHDAASGELRPEELILGRPRKSASCDCPRLRCRPASGARGPNNGTNGTT